MSTQVLVEAREWTPFWKNGEGQIRGQHHHESSGGGKEPGTEKQKAGWCLERIPGEGGFKEEKGVKKTTTATNYRIGIWN